MILIKSYTFSFLCIRKLYNEKNISSYNVDQEMDLLDFKIIEYCEKYKKPLLGICRGLQVINVYYGGSLYQNINNIATI